MAAVRLTRAAVSVAVVAYIVSLIPGARPHAGFSTFWDVGLNVTVLAGCALVCALRARAVRTDRVAWAGIGIGLACYAGGTLFYYAVLNHRAEIPYPSLSDGLWLLIYPFAIVGVGLLIRARMAGSVASMWLDGLVSGLGLASLSASFIFPRLTAEVGGSTASIVTNFAYPLADLALVAVVVGAMAALGAWRERSWLFLGAGFLVFAAADSVYLYQLATDTYHPASPVDASYLVGGLLVALAAGSTQQAPSLKPAGGRAENRSFLIPALFTLVAISVLVLGAWTRISPLGIVLAVGALMAACTRTALAVREVVRLSDSRRQARTDALTGLPNRRAFYELLEAAEAGSDSEQPAAGATVILIDLDRFKEINDALGHQVGDQVLRAVSHRLDALVPPGGNIARLGGDEIALLVPGTSTTEAVRLAERLLAALTEPFVIQGTSLHIDASIGITVVEPGTDAGRALAKADLAMYRAKKSRAGWEVYDVERDGDAWDRLATVEALREALAGDGLDVEFQPIVNAATGQPVGAEALVRWTDPVRGRVAPDAFLPLAESAGLMPALTRRVLNLALDEAVALRDLNRRIPISVNLSPSDLLDTQLTEYVAQALAQRGLTGDALRIEITESLLVEGASAAEFLLRLRALGIRLAVDDYGTGYSCMAYLHDLPVFYLKIDRGFTDRVLRDERTAIIVASTIDMAHRLNLQVVAEGVETLEQRDWLHGEGCDLLQGYLIGRSMTVDTLHAWLAENPTTGPALIPAQGASANPNSARRRPPDGGRPVRRAAPEGRTGTGRSDSPGSSAGLAG
jgi:diguanylate cyclase (GGDEF)-like protein